MGMLFLPGLFKMTGQDSLDASGTGTTSVPTEIGSQICLGAGYTKIQSLGMVG
jgi:hypothetical protein